MSENNKGMDKKINCIICGKEFTKRGNKLTCSPECSHRNQLKNSKYTDYKERKIVCSGSPEECFKCPFPDCIRG